MIMALPQEIKDVECLLTWMEETLSTFPTEGERENTQEGVLNWLKQPVEYKEMWKTPLELQSTVDKEDDRPSCRLEKVYNHQNPQYAGLLATHLVTTAAKVYAREFPEALEKLEKLKQFVLPLLTAVHARVLEPMAYVIETLEWIISVLTGGEPVLSAPARVEISKFQEKWRELQRNDQSKAVIVFLKGKLTGKILKHNKEKQLELLKQVREIDPDYHIWWHYSYEIARGLRLHPEQDDGQRGNQRVLLEMESELCLKARGLAENILLSNFDMAKMWKDKVFVEKTNKAQRNIAVGESVSFYNDALSLAQQNGLHEWILKLKIQKAELLQQFGGTGEEKVEGLRILEECLKSCPNDPLVHEKLAKVYFYGLQNNGVRNFLRDRDQARRHLKKAMELYKFQTMRVLEFYVLKLFGGNPNPAQDFVEEVLDMLTKSLEAYVPSLKKGDTIKAAKMRIWRGCVWWIYSPEGEIQSKKEACRDWLFVLVKYPNHEEELFANIQEPLSAPGRAGSNGAPTICTGELRRFAALVSAGRETESERRKLNMLMEHLRQNPRCCGQSTCSACRGRQRQAGHNSLRYEQDWLPANGNTTYGDRNQFQNQRGRVPTRGRQHESMADGDANWRS